MNVFCWKYEEIYISQIKINQDYIPVLHIYDVYWANHQLFPEDAVEGIEQSCQGLIQVRTGEADASRLEHNS